jgi:prephenate dehydratase
VKIAIQGELGSNSHMAALAMLARAAGAPIGDRLPARPRRRSLSGWSARSTAAVLPIENSLHGSVAEHYDLLLAQPVGLRARVCCGSATI